MFDGPPLKMGQPPSAFWCDRISLAHFSRALGVFRAQQAMQQNVIGFQRGIGAQFSAPIPFLLMLEGEQVLARGVDRGCDSGFYIV